MDHQFWFCRNPGLALPLIALQYHEVKVKLQFEDEAKVMRDVTAAAAVAGLNPQFDLESRIKPWWHCCRRNAAALLLAGPATCCTTIF